MKSGMIRMNIDLFGRPFIVDACTTDFTDTRLSTYEYIKEEINNCEYDDLFSVIEKEGIYRVYSKYDDYPKFQLQVIDKLINSGDKQQVFKLKWYILKPKLIRFYRRKKLIQAERKL